MRQMCPIGEIKLKKTKENGRRNSLVVFQRLLMCQKCPNSRNQAKLCQEVCGASLLIGCQCLLMPHRCRNR